MSTDRSWDLPESRATKEAAFRNRRKLLLGLGAAGLTAAGLGATYWIARGNDATLRRVSREGTRGDLARANEPPPGLADSEYPVIRDITDQARVGRYFNFYEFSPFKWEGAWRSCQALPLEPWTVEVAGRVENPGKFDVEELVKRFGTEQRVYHHRCVETWAMVVPWEGFPLRKLLDWARPLDTARYVRFETANVQSLAGRPRDASYPWPYSEGLTIEEAANELAFLATGFYGEALYKQNGAPFRLVVPWKYGFKSAKSLARIEFTAEKPATFWNELAPREYGFFANVDPDVPHPRWSQQFEWMIDDPIRTPHPTRKYNGYEEWVGDLYDGTEV